MAQKDSKLEGVLIKESGWIPGTKKPEKDYERVIAYNGKEFFIAYIITATKRFSPNEKERIWQRDIPRISCDTHEEPVKLYLPLIKLFESLPKK